MIETIQGIEGVPATCRAACQVMKTDGSGTDCPTGEACAVNLNAEAETGFCLPADSALEATPSLDACPAGSAGKMCGDNHYCVDNGGPYVCLGLCDFANQRGCKGSQRCIAGFSDGMGGSTTIGPYGLCQ